MDGTNYINAEIHRISKIVNSEKHEDCPFSEGPVCDMNDLEEKKAAPRSFEEFMEKLKNDNEI